MTRLVAIGIATLAALTLTALGLAAGTADTFTFTSKMTAGQEVPRPTGAKATAGGTFSATLKEGTSGGTLRWTLTFRNLTGKALAAHIHVGARGVAGDVLVPLCAAPAKPCKTGMTGRAHVNDDVLDTLEKKALYVNVHTAKNPAGEIRGQLRRTKIS